MILSLLPILLFFSFVFQLDYRPSSSSPLQILPSHPDGLQASSLRAIAPAPGIRVFPFSKRALPICSWSSALVGEEFSAF